MKGYTEEAAGAYSAQVREGFLRDFLRSYLEEQKTVSPMPFSSRRVLLTRMLSISPQTGSQFTVPSL